MRKGLVTAPGAAVISKDGVTALKVKLDASKLKRGMYVLSIVSVKVGALGGCNLASSGVASLC